MCAPELCPGTHVFLPTLQRRSVWAFLGYKSVANQWMLLQIVRFYINLQDIDALYDDWHFNQGSKFPLDHWPQPNNFNLTTE